MQDEYTLGGAVRFSEERHEWVGIVTKVQGKEVTVLTIGAEQTEAAILDWIRETVKLMRESGRTDVQAADMYDRAGTLPNAQH